MKIDVSKLKFDEKGLIPAIVQDVFSDEVLMLAYMNGTSLAKPWKPGTLGFGAAAVRNYGIKARPAGICRKLLPLLMIVMGMRCWSRLIRPGLPVIQGVILASFHRFGMRVKGKTCLFRNRRMKASTEPWPNYTG